MASRAVRAERLLHQHRRPVLLDDGPDQQRAQPRGQPRRLPGAVLRRSVPERHRCSATRTPRVKNDTIVAGNLNTVMPLVRNFLFTTEDEILASGWLQRVPAERRVEAAGRHQLLEGDARPAAVRDQRAVRAAAGEPARAAQRLRQRHVRAAQQRQHAVAVVRPRLHRSDAGAGRSDDLRRGLHQEAAHRGRADLVPRSTRCARPTCGGSRTTSFGVNYSDRTKDKKSPEAGLSTIGGGAYADRPGDLLLRRPNLNYADAGRALAWQRERRAARVLQPDRLRHPDDAWLRTSPASSGTSRKRSGPPTCAATSTTSSPTPSRLKGNVGLQVDRHRPELRLVPGRYQQRQRRCTSVTDGKDYTDVLPQINLAFILPDARPCASASRRQLARARMDQLKATEESRLRLGDRQPGGSGGNPELDPWRAWAFDVSYEKYFDELQGLRVGRGVLQGPRQLHLQPDGPNHDFSELLRDDSRRALPRRA